MNSIAEGGSQISFCCRMERRNCGIVQSTMTGEDMWLSSQPWQVRICDCSVNHDMWGYVIVQSTMTCEDMWLFSQPWQVRICDCSVNHYWIKALPHVTISSTMACNVAKIGSSASSVMKSSTISLRVAGPLVLLMGWWLRRQSLCLYSELSRCPNVTIKAIL